MRLSTCLVTLGIVLAAAPVLAQVKGAPNTVAVTTPALSLAPSSNSGCTPINPCAIVTPALGGVTMPIPQAPPQPDLPVTNETPTAAPPGAAAPAPSVAGRGALADCPAPGARGGFAGRGSAGGGRGRGSFAGGRGGEGRGAFAGRAGRGPFTGRGGRGVPPDCLPTGTGRGNPAGSTPR